MATVVYPYTQYSGSWNLSSQAQAKGAGTWPSPPSPKLFAWGSNSLGQLGLGNTTNYSSPVQVGFATNISKISSSGNSFYVKTDGTLWAWGLGNTGQLGQGNTTWYSSPKQVGSLTNWSKIYANYRSTFAIKTDGTLWSWGDGTSGQLGLGNITYYSSPKQVGALTNWFSISTDGSSSAILSVKTDGTLWSWGGNTYGGLGLGNTTQYSSPKQVGALTNWAIAHTGYAGAAYAVKTDGTLWVWGDNSSGQLGLGNTTYYSSPKQVGSLTNWKYAVSQQNSVVAIKTDGTIWGWGGNGFGQLGLGNTTYYSSPKQIGALTNWLEIHALSVSVIALKSDGTLWSWGNNGQGQLGLGNTTSYSSPKQIGNLTTWTMLIDSNSNGNYSTIAIALT